MPNHALPYYRSSDVRLHGLLALLHEDPRVQAFVEAEFGALLQHEAEYGSGLLHSSGSTSRSAATRPGWPS